MKFRKLRIAWFAAWIVVIILLIALWVRSKGQSESWFVGFTKSIGLSFHSGNGQLKLIYANYLNEPTVALLRWAYYVEPSDVNPTPQNAGFHISAYDKTKTAFAAPHWAAILVCGLIAAASWFRFSLRTLLIATGLVAVALGLIMWRSNSAVRWQRGAERREIENRLRTLDTPKQGTPEAIERERKALKKRLESLPP